MSKPGFSRRKFFKGAVAGGMGLAMGTALLEQIIDLWVVKAEHGSAVLDLHQMLTLGAIVAQIIPTDETPGAREAGVVETINTKLRDTPSSRPLYQNGLQEVDQLSRNKFGSLFVSLSALQQKDVLTALEKSRFFEQVWKDTVTGFSRSWVGQKVVGYPGGAQPHGYHDIGIPPKAS